MQKKTEVASPRGEEGALQTRLTEPRSWSAPPLAKALTFDGSELGPPQVTQYLHRLNERHRRQRPLLRHQQE
jgi:hypothetical protein